MAGPNKILNWMSIDVDPDVITRYQKKNKIPPAKKPVAFETNKKRGPVKAFFHITKNENVPAIEQQGLLANHPNANINSAFQPFIKHGSKGGGVWVTTEPSAFPVYGTTIGGKFGNASARADALSTFKIEVPVSELPKMLAVQDPYGKNILRKGNDPRAIEPFSTWLGNDVPTTVFLNNMKPEWLKNLGYVEERAAIHPVLDTRSDFNELRGSWGISPDNEDAVLLRHLSKADLRDYSGLTGHSHGFGTYDKSPQRFVEDYINWNRPITHRLPVFPVAAHPNRLGRLQGAVIRADETNASKRFGNRPLAFDWSDEYRDYVKPGEPVKDRRRYEFAPGAIARGMGGTGLPPIKARHFDWNKYNKFLSEGDTPQEAAFAAQPREQLNWDNIVYRDGRYEPQIISGHDFDALSQGSISRGTDTDQLTAARHRRVQRQVAAKYIRSKRNAARKYLARELGRQPTAEELDAWTRAGLFNDIEAGDLYNAPPVLSTYANKANWDLTERISDELFKRMYKK